MVTLMMTVHGLMLQDFVYNFFSPIKLFLVYMNLSKKILGKKVVTNSISIQVGMLPSCTVPSIAPMATFFLYLKCALKFPD